MITGNIQRTIKNPGHLLNFNPIYRPVKMISGFLVCFLRVCCWHIEAAGRNVGPTREYKGFVPVCWRGRCMSNVRPDWLAGCDKQTPVWEGDLCVRSVYGKAAVWPRPLFDRKLGDVASSLTSLTQNLQKRRRGGNTPINGVVWEAPGQAIHTQVSEIHIYVQMVDMMGVRAVFSPFSTHTQTHTHSGCTAALATRSGHIDSAANVSLRC